MKLQWQVITHHGVTVSEDPHNELQPCTHKGYMQCVILKELPHRTFGSIAPFRHIKRSPSGPETSAGVA